MSGRGGGRGRGGGGRGGRFGGGASVAQQYLQRSAQESGLDDRNLTTLQDITRPALFPDFVFHSSGRKGLLPDSMTASTTNSTSTSTTVVPLSQAVRTPSTMYLIQKGRDLQHRLQSSAHYVRLTSSVDVIRYGKPSMPIPSDQAVLQDCSAAFRADQRYFPQELLPPVKRLRTAKFTKTTATATTTTSLRLLDDLEVHDETLQLSPLHPTEEGDKDGEEDVVKVKAEGEEENLSDTGEVEEEQEEEEAEDYVTNYYESADEGSDDGGGGGGGADEATF